MKLFDKYLVDYSIAAATGLFDEKKLCWYDKALNIAGIDAEHLSELFPVEHYFYPGLLETFQYLFLPRVARNRTCYFSMHQTKAKPISFYSGAHF